MTLTNSVSNSQLLQTNLDGTDRAANATRTATKAAAPIVSAGHGNAGTTTTLSGAGSLLSAAATHGDDVRTSKVEALKASIASGSYHVSASDVVDKLLKHLEG